MKIILVIAFLGLSVTGLQYLKKIRNEKVSYQISSLHQTSYIQNTSTQSKNLEKRNDESKHELNWIDIDSNKNNKKSIDTIETLSSNIYMQDNGVLNYPNENSEFKLESESFDKFYKLD